MELTRREFIEQSMGVAGVLLGGCAAGRPISPPILVNHVGFVANRPKSFLLSGQQPTPFTIVRRNSGEIVHRGATVARGGDLGDYTLGDFTSLSVPGEFEVHAGESVSQPFGIDSLIYEPAMQKCVGYFARQRCGNSRTGHHAPCHLDDGRRADNGLHQDVTGGWHDACDLRKWITATLYGMIGLQRVFEVAQPKWDKGQIIEELRWGNEYFRKMQEPDGYVMSYCGGDDGNRYTNNIVGDSDDRTIHVEPAELPAQFQFASAQAAMSRLTRASDPQYAKSCEESARRCLNWCVKNRDPGAAITLAAAVMACIEMHRLSPSDRLQEQATEYLRKMLALQVSAPAGQSDSIQGFFKTSRENPQPLREITYGNLPGLALCEALDYFPAHPKSDVWRAALKIHTEYLRTMSDRSAFGTIPFGLYADGDPGGNRRIGSYWYRWFMKTRNETATKEWWVGINAHLASNGIALLKAGRLLGEPELTRLSQWQLDWILGANPFDASTVTDVGRNQPALYRTAMFSPSVPLIPGGVMNGIGGDEHDEPDLGPGSWNTCEYWTPMVAYTMWLLGDLQNVT